MWVCVPGGWPREVPGDAAPDGCAEVPPPPPFDDRAERLCWRGDEWHVEARPVEDVRVEMRAAVNVEAGRRILLIAPEWRQRNLTARAVVLSAMHPAQVPDEWLEPYRSEWAAGNAIWERINAIRAYSNVLTVAIASAETAAEVLAVVNGAQWPHEATDVSPPAMEPTPDAAGP